MEKYVLLLLLMVVGCSEFPTRYDLIENEKVRLLDIVYEPAEAAPGDTVNLTAIFAGKVVTSEMIDWNVSYKVTNNIYGADTAFEIQPLTCNPVQGEFTDRTSCVKLSFVVPDSIMYNSPMISNNWTEVLPVEYRGLISERYRQLSKKALIDTVRQLVSLFEEASEMGVQLSDEAKQSLVSQDLAGLLQVLSVNVRLFADVRGAHRVKSDYIVRYNTVFHKIVPEYIKVNNNPVIDSIVVYKVPETGLKKYNPVAGKHSAFRLYGAELDSESVIPIDSKSTYFIHSFTSKRDSCISLGGLEAIEEHFPVYYYKHNKNETNDIPSNNFMNIERVDNDSIYLLSPPANESIKSFTVWLEIGDRFYNEYNRPTASALQEFRGRFEYKK